MLHAAPADAVSIAGWLQQRWREERGLSLQAFASAYRIPLATLKGWEQGRRQSDATANAYLSVIARMPAAARDALHVV